jgi:hypothetical protein
VGNQEGERNKELTDLKTPGYSEFGLLMKFNTKIQMIYRSQQCHCVSKTG